ncbi:hypothetical protein COOONC_11297 [Cooperia oncophora]
MVAATFVMSSLSLSTASRAKQVLAIGLGGGSFNMGLHKINPDVMALSTVNITAVEIEPVVVQLAKKWFGVVNSRTHHTVVQDGVKFLEDAYTEGAEIILTRSVPLSLGHEG